MIKTANGLRKPTIFEAFFYFALSLLVNAFGNGLTVAANMGSSMWTASAANIANDFSFSISWVLIIYGASQILINIVLTRHFDWPHIFGNIIFISFFGPFVGFFKSFFLTLGIANLPLPIVISLDILGICLIATAVSIYQRLNLILHPGDEMTNILRFQYFKGNAKIAQWVNFSIPATVIIVLMLIFRQITAVNIGTLFAFFFQGTVLNYADKVAFPKLKHRL
ncbi:hypothetical protein Hs30E_18140 [Lactococcus hodotermopsidis]|uniref:Sugar specific permease n=1 Tax=Pseudolactococcus hodotermopsidis TaxID=2709157 RepID=A0A6A0BEY4_9LACT|nr:hypothetical protein [Lactococcus hodotermopsidis]GFH43263.1 hypothetical protein Hs30E_18140 [Lactococcus hodotermopsidis]